MNSTHFEGEQILINARTLVRRAVWKSSAAQGRAGERIHVRQLRALQ